MKSSVFSGGGGGGGVEASSCLFHYYYRGTIVYSIGPNIVGKNSKIYRFLCVPQVLFGMSLLIVVW